MADVVCVDAALPIPLVLEGQGGEHGVEPAADLAGTPPGPRPQLRRDEEVDRDAGGMGPPGQGKVEARVVDEHDSVGPGRLEVLSRLSGEPDERADAEK